MAATTCTSPAPLFGTGLPKVCKAQQRPTPFGEIALIAFLIAQCVDGVLTYLGVTAFGVGVEANPLVGTLMTHLGQGPGLLSAKMLAGILGICLYLNEIHGAVAMLAAFYFTVAITPWTLILFF